MRFLHRATRKTRLVSTQVRRAGHLHGPVRRRAIPGCRFQAETAIHDPPYPPSDRRLRSEPSVRPAGPQRCRFHRHCAIARWPACLFRVLRSFQNGRQARTCPRWELSRFFARQGDEPLQPCATFHGEHNCLEDVASLYCSPDGHRLIACCPRKNRLVVCDREPKTGLLKLRQVITNGTDASAALQASTTWMRAAMGNCFTPSPATKQEQAPSACFGFSRAAMSPSSQQILNGRAGARALSRRPLHRSESRRSPSFRDRHVRRPDCLF